MTHRNTRDDVIVDPRAFQRTAAPSSPLWALLDSLEAATNGMANPEAASRLSRAEEEAFTPWKALISAIRAFYDDDAVAALDALDRISDSAPPAALKPLFRAWAMYPDPDAGEELLEAPAAVAALHRRVLGDPHPAAALAEQAEEALRQGMVDHFESMACKVLRELHEATRADGPLLALRYLARCLSLLDEAGEEDGAFFEAVIRTLGRADALAALGLALVGRDDKAAIAAFRAALASSGPHPFIDADTRLVISAAVDILDNKRPRTDKRSEGRASKRKSKQAPAGQLELFSAEAV